MMLSNMRDNPNANGWEIVPSGATPETTASGQPRCRKFYLPGTGRHIWLRDGVAGLLLADLSITFNKSIEKIGPGIYDIGGYNLRPIGGTNVWSMHGYGLAVDINPSRHPFGAANTFSRVQRFKIRRMLKRRYKGVIRWGGEWSHPDDMHFEIDARHDAVRKVALDIFLTERGKSILAGNPGLRGVIRG